MVREFSDHFLLAITTFLLMGCCRRFKTNMNKKKISQFTHCKLAYLSLLC